MTKRQARIALAAMLHGYERGRGGSSGLARDVLAWIKLVEDELYGEAVEP